MGGKHRHGASRFDAEDATALARDAAAAGVDGLIVPDIPIEEGAELLQASREAEVAWIVGTHYDPERDIQFTRGPVDDLEDASDLAAYGSKMGIDATRKWASEGFTRPWPKKIGTTEQAARKAEDVWQRISRGWKP